MELKDYITPLLKWWWLIVAATVVATGASFFVARQQPNQYRTRTTMMIGRAIDNPNPSGTEFWLTQQLAQTYAEIASREPVRIGTMEALGLAWLPRYSVNSVANTQLIEIAVTDSNPARAQAVANELAQQLILQSPTNPEQDDQLRQEFVNEQLDALEIRIKEAQEEITDKQEQLTNTFSARQLSELENQIGGLQNKLTTMQSNYAGLLANTRQGAINSLSVIGPAALPTSPINPNTWTTVIMAGAVGFVIAAAAAYILEFLDDSVRTADDIMRTSELPTLAGIAHINADDASAHLVTINEPRSPISEAYRVLRTGIQFSSVDAPEQQILMVTSANPGEGKSHTAANLAVVLAQAGNRVLILDADLRRPVQHKIFGAVKNRGLTNYLLDSNPSGDEEALASLKRVIQPTPVRHLQLLTSGPIPPNPSELLDSAKMKALLAVVGDEFDFVIVDSPPVLAVTDATVLSRRSDGVLLVTEAGKTRKGQLKQAVEQLRSTNAQLIGVVLNQLSPRGEGYYQYYYYRNAYYLDEEEELEDSVTSANGKESGQRLPGDSTKLPQEVS